MLEIKKQTLKLYTRASPVNGLDCHKRETTWTSNGNIRI